MFGLDKWKSTAALRPITNRLYIWIIKSNTRKKTIYIYNYISLLPGLAALWVAFLPCYFRYDLQNEIGLLISIHQQPCPLKWHRWQSHVRQCNSIRLHCSTFQDESVQVLQGSRYCSCSCWEVLHRRPSMQSRMIDRLHCRTGPGVSNWPSGIIGLVSALHSLSSRPLR